MTKRMLTRRSAIASAAVLPLATPHIAGVTHETLYDMSAAAAEQWMGLLRGRVPPRLVNPEIWPLYSERFERIIGYRPDPLP